MQVAEIDYHHEVNGGIQMGDIVASNAFKLMLKAMPIGLTVRTVNDLGEVKRKSRDSWVLFADGVKTRSRWGNLDEMTADLVYFNNCGVLPEPQRVQGF